MQRIVFSLVASLAIFCAHAQSIVTDKPSKEAFSILDAVICVDPDDEQLVQQSAICLQKDIKMVTGMKLPISTAIPSGTAIIIGSLERSSLIRSLERTGKVNLRSLKNKWEAYQIKSSANNIIIAGSDRRGTAYGVFELSRQLGISPWYWWADVPVIKKENIFINKNISVSDAPKVKYRGIFINDEAPALSNWSKEQFGGFNHHFYEKVFELILRLKGNYIWPAMWGNAFYDDDSLNIKTADKYGIVIGTSHHEPLMRAHDEWRRYGSGKWNYDSNAVKLKAFWQSGIERAWNEKIVTVGMRGDGDEPMSRETATALLEKIVAGQRKIIADVTGKPESRTPQLWALYKEVQDYYDKGMRVPDDVTLLLCDDNWGNIRKLPRLNDKPRSSGYGIYYHFDYVGGPRNYKWLNTNPLPRIWEQMHLAWEYNVRRIWIVNVGDIKPMEFPISFFLDYAWNPEKIGANDLQGYSQQWAGDQFGKQYAKDIADLLNQYAKYNARRKPELLDAKTYSLGTGEWQTIVNDYNNLLKKAEDINHTLPSAYKDAYFQLVLHPIKACANLNELYYNVALNENAYANKWVTSNNYANKVKELYANDSLITEEYHRVNNGKWHHMMSQTHIGYTYWQQPERQKMPEVHYISPEAALREKGLYRISPKIAEIPQGTTGNVFYEEEKKGVSIAADHYTRAINTNAITWKILPDHGRTGSAITAFPVTAAVQKPGSNAPHLEYEIYTYSTGNVSINTYHSPTLNFHNTEEGLQYAVSIDDETPKIISINKEDKTTGSGIWNKWVSENIIVKSSQHLINRPGKHVVKYWMINSGVVLQKLVLDFGDSWQFYLGPPETVQLQTPSLKETFNNDFTIGTALNAKQIEEKDPEAQQLIQRQFNTVTPENIMKAVIIHPDWDRYDFDMADKLIKYGEKYHMKINGHTLIWHSQLPAFARRIQDADSFKLFFTNHIKTVAGRYSGKVFSWDVVNEALNEDGTMRKSIFLDKIGNDFVTEAFRLAQAASPNTELYYNDYNNEQPQKRAGCIALIKKIQAAGVRIDGVGIQGHWEVGKIPLKEIEESIIQYAALGLKVMITELDIEVLPRSVQGADVNQQMKATPSLNPYTHGLPDSIQQQLASDYEALFALFLKHRDKIDRVTFWGVNDGQSWLNNWPVRGRTNYPLLFDRQFNPKPAFYKVVSVKKGGS